MITHNKNDNLNKNESVNGSLNIDSQERKVDMVVES
jgi:phage-related protein